MNLSQASKTILLEVFYHLGFCKDFDVSLGEDGSPFIFYEKLWWPINGQFFSDNDNGAVLFCQKLNYTSGNVFLVKDNSTRKGQKDANNNIKSWNKTIPMDSFMVGKCIEGDDSLENCTGGWNLALYRKTENPVTPIGKICRNEKCIMNKGNQIAIQCTEKENSRMENYIQNITTTESEEEYNATNEEGEHNNGTSEYEVEYESTSESEKDYNDEIVDPDENNSKDPVKSQYSSDESKNEPNTEEFQRKPKTSCQGKSPTLHKYLRI